LAGRRFCWVGLIDDVWSLPAGLKLLARRAAVLAVHSGLHFTVVGDGAARLTRHPRRRADGPLDRLFTNALNSATARRPHLRARVIASRVAGGDGPPLGEADAALVPWC
jgi:hypothetical protein